MTYLSIKAGYLYLYAVYKKEKQIYKLFHHIFFYVVMRDRVIRSIRLESNVFRLLLL